MTKASDLLRSLISGCCFLLASACTAAPPTVDGVQHTLFEPELTPRAQVVAVHGFNDHKQAFDDFAAFAQSRGVLVETYDQQGFGENDNWGWWVGRDVLVRDLVVRIRARHAADPGVPLFVLGESMGAAVAILALARHPDLPVDGAIFSAPAVWGGEAMNPFYRGVLWLAARIVPGLRLTGRGLGVQASDNIDMLRALGRDPLVIKATRIDALAGLVDLMAEARAAGPSIALPRLILTGRRDEIVPPEAMESFVATLPSSRCTYIRYEDGWHMLLRDLQRERVWKDIIAWIEGIEGIEAADAVAGDACGDGEKLSSSLSATG